MSLIEHYHFGNPSFFDFSITDKMMIFRSQPTVPTPTAEFLRQRNCTAYRVFMKMSKENGIDVAPVLEAARIRVPWCPFNKIVASSLTRTHTKEYLNGRKYVFSILRFKG
ncbi:uncharacterized protein LOC125758867 [Rhipicephalus sanguineus]|uniref:uncharacterized protein LOC125758867 n=1 Tax=Rhipicephalus sanguineus TaxID=34632 RepID=UPI0020C1F269|nr:uncharacterized protein LOC125758867 [Rhipicephalus sanguineus]